MTDHSWFPLAVAELRIAYLINQYPRVSHVFIRREILALERQGLEVQRIALRGWDAETLTAEDREEQRRTQYILEDGILPLGVAMAARLLRSPGKFLSALRLAFQVGWRADRSLGYHLAYLAEACRMLPWLEASGAAHVHAHFGTNAAEIVMLVRALGGPPYSVTIHGPEELDKPEFLHLGEKIRRSAFIVAITSFARSQLFRWVEHAHWPKIKVIRCGIEPGFYQGVSSAPTVEAPRFVSVGRLSAQKGQLLLLEAARVLARKGIAFELVLIGDGEMRREIEALIAAYSLGGHVRMTGALGTEDLREEMLRSRALVLPSFAEGLPVVIMEAMALRKPVLTTYIAGIPELVVQGKTGWLFPAGSVEALTDALEDCLSRSADELRLMGEAAHARVLERHCIDKEAKQLADAFRQACARAVVP
jgi:glycosyltransferase involved in cell wall biosynthesis